MSDLLYAHIAGQTVIQTLIKNGKCIFSKRTIEELKAENPGIEFGNDEWIDKRLAEAGKEKYLDKPWEQISEDDYNWGMNSMPPIKDIGSCFANPEAIFDGIYMHYVRLIEEDEPRFFKAPRLFKSWWSDLIKELKEQRTAH
jgi:hypothetical protein